jgi:NADH-quinone oxidoreductase subunit K
VTETTLLHHYLVVGAILFGLGLAGFLARRNVIVMFLCAELMLQGISLGLVGWGRFHDDWGGQVLVTFVIAVAASEAAIALVLTLMLSQYAGNLDVAAWQFAREEGLEPYIDHEVPEELPEESHAPWPVLTPAGVQPSSYREQESGRPRV